MAAYFVLEKSKWIYLRKTFPEKFWFNHIKSMERFELNKNNWSNKKLGHAIKNQKCLRGMKKPDYFRNCYKNSNAIGLIITLNKFFQTKLFTSSSKIYKSLSKRPLRIFKQSKNTLHFWFDLKRGSGICEFCVISQKVFFSCTSTTALLSNMMIFCDA